MTRFEYDGQNTVYVELKKDAPRKGRIEPLGAAKVYIEYSNGGLPIGFELVFDDKPQLPKEFDSDKVNYVTLQTIGEPHSVSP